MLLELDKIHSHIMSMLKEVSESFNWLFHYSAMVELKYIALSLGFSQFFNVDKLKSIRLCMLFSMDH